MTEKSGFQFVHIASPGDAAAWKRQVRAHAARNPRSRKQRVSRHQSMAGASLKSSLAGPVADKAAFDTTMWAYERLPRGMSAASVDPFDTFARIPTRVEWSLLHHCKPLSIKTMHVCFCYTHDTCSPEGDTRARLRLPAFPQRERSQRLYARDRHVLDANGRRGWGYARSYPRHHM